MSGAGYWLRTCPAYQEPQLDRCRYVTTFEMKFANR